MNFKKFDAPLHSIDVTEWGLEGRNTVYVRELTAFEHAELLEILHGDEKDVFRRSKIVIRFALDEQGQRIFTEDNLNDIADSSCKPTQRIINALLLANTVTNEELEKN
jgi:hypothetical protein